MLCPLEKGIQKISLSANRLYFSLSLLVLIQETVVGLSNFRSAVSAWDFVPHCYCMYGGYRTRHCSHELCLVDLFSVTEQVVISCVLFGGLLLTEIVW